MNHLSLFFPQQSGCSESFNSFSGQSLDLSRFLPLNRPVFVPIFSKDRLLENIPVVFTHAELAFGRSRATLNVIGGALKGRVVQIDSAQDENEAKKRCLEFLMNIHIHPYVQRVYPESIA